MDRTKFARHLRRNESKAESIFWNVVRNRKLLGLKFRRQVPIDVYFADFVCEETKLIVELDDVSHTHRQAKDLKRTETLKTYGYKVIRFNNEDVYEDLDAVLDELESELKKRA